MTNPELTRTTLEENLLSLFTETPLDDLIDALEGALRRRASDLSASPEDADLYRNTALELHELKERDFELSDTVDLTIQ